MLYTLSGYTMHDYHRTAPRRGESDGEKKIAIFIHTIPTILNINQNDTNS
jgi:hypothetical protein